MSSTVGGEEEDRVDIDAIVDVEYSSMLAIGVALLRDHDDAVELAQETMLRLQQHWERVSSLDRPGAWCRRVALNLATDMLRDRKRRRGLAERVAAAEAATARDVDSCWDERFWHHVSDLPERQRNVVVLHYVHDLAVDSIGEILEVPAGTIKSDLSRARTRLRALMEEES